MATRKTTININFPKSMIKSALESLNDDDVKRMIVRSEIKYSKDGSLDLILTCSDAFGIYKYGEIVGKNFQKYCNG